MKIEYTKHKLSLRFVSCIILLISCFSCVTLTSNDTVLQKSTDQIPAWINENGKINSQNPEYINLVFSKGDLYNLPLGVKQSQTIATKKISYLFLTEIQKQLQLRLEKINLSHKNTSLDVASYTISHIINKYLIDFKIDPPLAEQVYWEYRQQERAHDSKQYYIVWVLLLVPKTVYDKAFLTIAHELQNSKDEATVTLGNDILQQPEKR